MGALKLSILLLTAINILSGQDFILPLWPENIPNHNGSKVVETVDTTEIVMIKKVDIPNITVYLPTKKSATGRAILIVPGGGYNILAYHWEGTDIAKWLNSKGIAAIVLKYRLPHTKNNIVGHLSPFLDVQRAMRLTRYNADKWHFNKKHIGIIGFSAGGHLASTLGTHFNEPNLFMTDAIDTLNCRPDFMILVYPVITMHEPFLHKGSRHFLLGEHPSLSLVDYFSNELYVTKDTPPTFIVHAGDDQSVPVENSIMFYTKLNQNGVPAELHIYPQGGHGFSLAIGIKHLQTWPDRCIEWINNLE